MPALLYGIRLWTAVCLALFVAFWLELDSAFWAGTPAAIVCHPVLGASLRKGWFRMVGTVIGAIAAVVLSALFPQSRPGFLLGLAMWAGVCALVATLLRNFASYAAAMSGFTAAIIAGNELGAVGGPTAMPSTLLSRAPPRPGSASCAPASSSPAPTSAARAGGWQRCSPACRPMSPVA
jgi:uncharacterized membrane protein YccC